MGAAGMILTIIMCRGMNRSLANVLFARFSLTGTGEKEEYVNVKSGDPVDAAIAMANANNVIIVPGYGLAAAQAHDVGQRGSGVALGVSCCDVRVAVRDPQFWVVEGRRLLAYPFVG